MRGILLLLTAVSLAVAADPAKTDDPWIKVKELKSGSDVRVFKKGSTQPINAQIGDTTDDKLIVIVNKKEQRAIDRKDIERVDYRPASGKPVKTESESIGPDGQRNWSAGTSWSREGWKTVYQRTAGK